MQVKQILKKGGAFTLILALCFTLVASFSTTEVQAASKTHLKKTSITLTVGKSYSQKLLTASGKTISSSKVTWKSTDKNIATVSSKGVIKAKKAGTVTIKATYKGKTYKCKCTVKKSLDSQVKLVTNKVNLGMEEINLALKKVRKSEHLGAVIAMWRAIEEFDEAIEACNSYYELKWVKNDLELINNVLKDQSYYKNGGINVSGTRQTSAEIVAAVETILPYLEDVLEELARI